MSNVLELCQRILHFGSEAEVDYHAEKSLKRALFEYRQAPKKGLAKASYMVNGREYESLLLALGEVEVLRTAGIRFSNPNLEENWDYNVPTKAMALVGRGCGWVERFTYKSFSLDKWDRSQQIQRDNVMLRCFPSKFYFPQSIKTKSIDPRAEPERPFIPNLVTLEEFWRTVRSTGLVPLEIKICAYTKEVRYSYGIDLVTNRLLKDFRGGQVPLRNKAKRSSIDYLNFDMVLASTDMRELVKKVFIELFEVTEATAFDISHTMGITDVMARNSLDAIVARGIAEKEGRSPREMYFIRSESLALAAASLG
jgi:hypothetical protein